MDFVSKINANPTLLGKYPLHPVVPFNSTLHPTIFKIPKDILLSQPYIIFQI